MKEHVNHHLLDRGAPESKRNDFGEVAASVSVQPACTCSAPEMMALGRHVTYWDILQRRDIIVDVCGFKAGRKL